MGLELRSGKNHQRMALVKQVIQARLKAGQFNVQKISGNWKLAGRQHAHSFRKEGGYPWKSSVQSGLAGWKLYVLPLADHWHAVAGGHRRHASDAMDQDEVRLRLLQFPAWQAGDTEVLDGQDQEAILISVSVDPLLLDRLEEKMRNACDSKHRFDCRQFGLIGTSC